MKLSLAQYRELEAFSQFASDLDDVTRKQLERGERMMELMKQKQYAPLSIAEMAVSLCAVEKGYLDDVELEKICSFEKALHDYLNDQYKDFSAEINKKAHYDDAVVTTLKELLTRFKETQTW